MQIAVTILAVLLIFTGGLHFARPKVYRPILPRFLPEKPANWLAGLAEIAIGAGLLLADTRSAAGLAFMLLMLTFLPLHVWDLFRPRPAMGSRAGAVVRLLLQFGLIWWGWLIWQAG